MMSRFSRTAPVLGLVALLSFGPAHAEEPFDTVGPFVQYSLLPSDPFTTLRVDTPVTVSGATASGALSGAATVNGQGQLGSAKLTVNGSGAGYSVFAFAGWTDEITIVPTVPAQAGQAFTLTYQLGVDWSASDANRTAGGSQVYVDLNLLAVGGDAAQYAFVGDSFVQGNCTLATTCGLRESSTTFAPLPAPSITNNIASFSLSGVLGQTYLVTFGLNVLIDGTGGTASVDAGHSMSWIGIAGVQGADGNPLNYTVTSASGFNYTAAQVPEPAAMTLLLLGLGLLWPWQAARAGRLPRAPGR